MAGRGLILGGGIGVAMVCFPNCVEGL
jgi:hypothetical protein